MSRAAEKASLLLVPWTCAGVENALDDLTDFVIEAAEDIEPGDLDAARVRCEDRIKALTCALREALVGEIELKLDAEAARDEAREERDDALLQLEDAQAELVALDRAGVTA